MYGTITYVANTAAPRSNTTTTDALIYARQSKVIGDDELAVLRQQEDGAKLAALRGWRIARTFVDNDISAAGKAVRPGFEAALKMIESGTVKAIIAWDLTRLTRNARDRLRLIDTCSRHQVTIALVRGADIDPATPGGRLVAGVLGEVAEHEIAQKADRQRRAAQQAAEAGRPYVKGRRAFGYEPDGVTLRPVEADALRQAYDDVLHGVPLARIARDFNAKGLYTPQLTRARRGPGGEVVRAPEPSQWTAQTLGLTLLNPRYAGLRARTVRHDGRRQGWEIVCRAVWEPVVPEQVWQAVRDVLTNAERRNTPRSEQALLTGVALCGVCCPPGDTPPAAGHESFVHGGRTRRGERTYRCRAALGHVVRAAEPVERYVGTVIVERLSRQDAADLLVDHSRPDVAALRTEAAALRKRRDAQVRMHADGDITDAELAAGSRRIRARLAEIADTLAVSGRADLLGPLVHADDVAAAWEAMDTDRQRAVVDELVTVRILPPGRGVRRFRPETVDVQWIR